MLLNPTPNRPSRYSPARVVRGIRRRVNAVLQRTGNRATRPFAQTGGLASTYFFAFSRTFDREHRAVLAGKQRYLKQRAAGSERYLLRRNVHMLEKGLIMRPRRDIFALNYIEETVECFGALSAKAGACDADLELQWANDVLSSYFDIAGEHPIVHRARRNFERSPLGSDARSTSDGLSPYHRVTSDVPPVAYDDLLRLAEQRRSVRWFEPRPVPRELVEKAVRVAGLSPSACNRQPFEFRVFDDSEQVQAVAEIPMGTRGWVQNIQTFVVIVGSLSAFFSERDRHLIYTDGCLAAMSFLLALETLGLSSCCVNWPDIAERERKMADLLELGPDERPVMCIAVGYANPEGMVPFSQKKSTSELTRFN
jgi:nitroreductase